MTEMATSVFISYAREDADFVGALHGALREAGYNAFLDREDIAPAEAWKERLGKLILAADAVIFVMTDHSLSSAMCTWEVDLAKQLSKRIVPLAHGPISHRVPEGLDELNWIFSDDPGGGAQVVLSSTRSALTKLRQAIDVDIKWVREHSRLIARASHWVHAQEAELREALLLRQGEVDRARSWMEFKPGGTAPNIPKVLIDYVNASAEKERVDKDRQRRVIQRGFVEAVRRTEPADAALRRLAAGAILSADPSFALENDVDEPNRSALWRAGIKRIIQPLFVQTCGPDDYVFCGALSRCGSRVITGFALRAIVWDALTGEQICVLEGPKSKLQEAYLSPDNRFALTVSQGGICSLWDADTGKELRRFTDHAGGFGSRKSSTFSSDGRLIVRAHSGGTISVWDRAKEAYITSIPGSAPIDISRDNTLILSCAYADSRTIIPRTSGVLAIHECQTGKRRVELSPESTNAGVARISDDMKFIVAGGSNGFAGLWSAQTGALVRELKGHKKTVSDVHFAPGSKKVLTASWDGTIRIWSVDTDEQLRTLAGTGDKRGSKHPDRSDAVESASFSGDGTRIYAVSSNGVARIWDAAEGPLVAEIEGHASRVRSVKFDDIGQRIASASADGTARIWDVATGTCRSILKLSKNETKGFNSDARIVTSATFFDDGDKLLTTHFDGLVKLWCLSPVAEVGRFQCSAHPVWCATFMKTAKAVLLGLADGFLELRRLPDGELLRRLKVSNRAHVSAIKLDPKEETLATATADGLIQVWNFNNFSRRWQTQLNAGTMLNTAFGAVDFDLSGTRLAMGCIGQAIVADAATGEAMCELNGHRDTVRTICFSRDGERVATASGDHTVRIWDSNSGDDLLHLQHPDVVTSATFAPTSDLLVSSCSDGKLRLWDLARTKALCGSRGVTLCAALDCGIGHRTDQETTDVLLEAAPDDMFVSMVAGAAAIRIAHGTLSNDDGDDQHLKNAIKQKSAALRQRLDERCYLPNALKRVG